MKIAYRSQQLQRLINSYPNKLDTATRKAMRQASKLVATAIRKDVTGLPEKISDVRVLAYSSKNSATTFIGLNNTPFRYFDASGMQLPIQKTFKPASGVSLLDKTVAGSFVGTSKDSNKLMVFIRTGGRMKSNSKKESIEQVKTSVEEYFDKAIRKNEITAADIFATLANKYTSEIQP